MNSTWLITSELAHQGARKVPFTCVVYTNYIYLLVNNSEAGAWQRTPYKREKMVPLSFRVVNCTSPECKLTLEELASLRGRIKLTGLLKTWIVFQLIFSDKPGFYCYCSIHSRFIT